MKSCYALYISNKAGIALTIDMMRERGQNVSPVNAANGKAVLAVDIVEKGIIYAVHY